jgi:hypothetical protein
MSENYMEGFGFLLSWLSSSQRSDRPQNQIVSVENKMVRGQNR